MSCSRRSHDPWKWSHLVRRISLNLPPSIHFYSSRNYDLILRWTDGKRFESIVEVGTGTCLAPICAKFMHSWKRVVAVDISEGVLEYARERCERWGVEVELVRADAREMPFSSGEFDSLLSQGLLEHYPDQASEFIGEMSRISKRLVLDIPINQRHPEVEEGYGDEFLAGEPDFWRRLVEGRGLRILEEFIRERRRDGKPVCWGCVCEARSR